MRARGRRIIKLVSNGGLEVTALSPVALSAGALGDSFSDWPVRVAGGQDIVSHSEIRVPRSCVLRHVRIHTVTCCSLERYLSQFLTHSYRRTSRTGCTRYGELDALRHGVAVFVM